MQLIESLESRQLFASFTAASVADLIADINAANAAGGSNTIALAAGTTFNLSAVDNSTFALTGLPVIAAGDTLTIDGNGGTIQRITARGAPVFRLLAVDAGASLTLNNLTLSNGAVISSGGPNDYTGEGGAIWSQGTLNLNAVTVQNSMTQGYANAYFNIPAKGGGIFSAGILTIANSLIQKNQALGGVGNNSSVDGSGGQANGGGLYVTGSATLTNTRVSSNLARGGDGQKGYSLGGKGKLGFPQIQPGGDGGDASGGGIFVGTGTLELRGTTITQNAATGGAGGNSPKGSPAGANGIGKGGGLYIYPSASASLDSFTQANTFGNTASTSDNDIFGSFSALL